MENTWGTNYFQQLTVHVFRMRMLTSGDDSLQSNDVGMVELAHDAGFTEKVTSLLLRVSGFKTLDGHLDLPFTGQPQTPTTNLSELTWESNKSLSTN